MKKQREKRITVDELARMTQDGFKKMHAVLKNEFREHTKVVIEEFRRLNTEAKDIKTTLNLVS